MKRLLTIALVALIALSAPAQNYTFLKGIRYKNSQDPYVREKCQLDVAFKQGATDRPVIVWFHGGGLIGGYRELPEALLTKDYVIVGVGYRFSPKASFPEILDDAAAAVAWTFAHIAEYGGSPDKVYIAGHSAGGYIVAMIGLDKRYMAPYGIDPDSCAGICPMSGQMMSHFNERALRGVDPLTPEINDLSPIAHMRPDCPPMLLVTGDRELELYGRYEENAYFWRMMKLKGHKDIVLYEEDGLDHGGMLAPGFRLIMEFVSKRER